MLQRKCVCVMWMRAVFRGFFFVLFFVLKPFKLNILFKSYVLLFYRKTLFFFNLLLSASPPHIAWPAAAAHTPEGFDRKKRIYKTFIAFVFTFHLLL